MIEGQYVDLENKITITELSNSNFTSNAFNKTYYDEDTDCWMNSEWIPGSMCSTGIHTYIEVQNGVTCNAQYQPTNGFYHNYIITCNQTGSGSTSPDGNNTSSGNTSGEGSDYNEEPDETIVVPCTRDVDCIEQFDPIHDDNCQELQSLLDVDPTTLQPSFKTLKEAIADLKTDLGGDSEQGYSFRFSSTLGKPLVKVSSQNTGEGFCDYPTIPNVFGGIHLHVDNTNPYLDNDYEPMFSHADIKNLLEFTETYNNPNNPPDNALFVYMLVTYQGTYAIKIKDLTKLQQLNSIWNNKKKKRKFLRDLDMAYARKTDQFDNPNGTAEDYQKIFLEHVNVKYDLGISLFKTIEENGIPIGWEELTLKNVGTANVSIDPKPCN